MKQLSSILYSVTGKGFSMPAFIIEKNEKELILIDSGLKKDAHAMIRKIESKWGSLDKISTIIFTHRHADHTGGLPVFLDKINFKKIVLIAHQDEEPLFNELFKAKGISITKSVKHNEIIDKKIKLRAIHTPGHTFGHLCLLLEEEKLLLIGDLIMDIFGKLFPVFKKAHDDFQLWEKNLATILDYDWNYAIPSHMSVKKISREKIEEFILKRTK
ncbi:MAG TPA: MBL fold metallo-hydrolase [candidate division Zixibacteria bacterium]|nr:MBL fold metallo-hydrolase [candidate division Zixibacteria bacterium]